MRSRVAGVQIREACLRSLARDIRNRQEIHENSTDSKQRRY